MIAGSEMNTDVIAPLLAKAADHPANHIYGGWRHFHPFPRIHGDDWWSRPDVIDPLANALAAEEPFRAGAGLWLANGTTCGRRRFDAREAAYFLIRRMASKKWRLDEVPDLETAVHAVGELETLLSIRNRLPRLPFSSYDFNRRGRVD